MQSHAAVISYQVWLVVDKAIQEKIFDGFWKFLSVLCVGTGLYTARYESSTIITRQLHKEIYKRGPNGTTIVVPHRTSDFDTKDSAVEAVTDAGSPGMNTPDKHACLRVRVQK